MIKLLCGSALVISGALAEECTVPADTAGADDGNPHCWTRARRCDGPNAHPDTGVGYQPACGVCEGLGGIAGSDEAEDIEIPACTKLDSPYTPENPPPKGVKWA